MGTRAIENRVKKLKDIEVQQKALEEQAEKIKAEIKSEMEAQGTDELHTGSFIVRWKTVLSNRFDSLCDNYRELPGTNAAAYDNLDAYLESLRILEGEKMKEHKRKVYNLIADLGVENERQGGTVYRNADYAGGKPLKVRYREFPEELDYMPYILSEDALYWNTSFRNTDINRAFYKSYIQT